MGPMPSSDGTISEVRVHDPVFGFLRRLARHVGKRHKKQFASQTPFVEFHGLSAVSIERQKRGDFFHDGPSADYWIFPIFLPSAFASSTASPGAKSSISKNCRTSSSPSWKGVRFAHSMASSRDFTLMIQ
jgi:hypothetical protein